MTERDHIHNLLALRKLTRAIADPLRAQMLDHLSTLTPLLRPRTVLGDYIQGGPRESIRKADKAFKELQALYESIATAKPFNLPREMPKPINLPGLVNLEITPLEYPHKADATNPNKTIAVCSPLTWVLTYKGFSLSRLAELVAAKGRAVEDLQQIVLAFLVLHVVVDNQPGVSQMLAALHFPLSTEKSPDYGDLPITIVRSVISTSRPSDDTITHSAELTGVAAFEEVVNVGDIIGLDDPFKTRLLEILKREVPELAPAGI